MKIGRQPNRFLRFSIAGTTGNVSQLLKYDHHTFFLMKKYKLIQNWLKIVEFH